MFPSNEKGYVTFKVLFIRITKEKGCTIPCQSLTINTLSKISVCKPLISHVHASLFVMYTERYKLMWSSSRYNNHSTWSWWLIELFISTLLSLFCFYFVFSSDDNGTRYIYCSVIGLIKTQIKAYTHTWTRFFFGNAYHIPGSIRMGKMKETPCY